MKVALSISAFGFKVPIVIDKVTRPVANAQFI